MREETTDTRREDGEAGGRARLLSWWGWEEALVACGCVLCVTAAAALPWARVDLRWRSILFGDEMELGVHSFRLTDNPWLAAALICVAALCLLGLFSRRYAWGIAAAASLLLLAGCAAYAAGLIGDAYDFLGIYERLLELVRSFPMVGPLAEAVIRERLSISAFPHAGLYMFLASSLCVLAGGLLLRRRSRLRV